LLGIGGVAIALAVGLLTVDVGAFVQQMMGTFASSQAETTLDLAKNVSKIAAISPLQMTTRSRKVIIARPQSDWRALARAA
jgi:hypothetical protein